METELSDPVLKEIVSHLRTKHRCHTVLLYGSRARGAQTATSDYDVLGVRKSGSKTRIAKKKAGAYWDVFVYPEKELRKLTDRHMDWRSARVLYEQGTYGRMLVKRIDKLVNRPFKPAPAYEISVSKEWAQKQLDRIAADDIHGHYRRCELLTAAVDHYFQIRRLRYWGPKAGLLWLKDNDLTTFKLFDRALREPTNARALKSLVARVYWS